MISQQVFVGLEDQPWASEAGLDQRRGQIVHFDTSPEDQLGDIVTVKERQR